VKRSVRAVCAVLALWLMALSAIPAAFADDIDDKRKELDDTQSRMEQAQQQKETATQSIAVSREKLKDIMGKIAQLQKEINELQKKADTLQVDIDKNTDALNAKKAEMTERIKIYKKRLRNIYENGQVNYLEVLLGAKDFGDFSSRMYLLQKIIQSDLDLVASIRSAAGEIQYRQNLLNNQMAEIKKDQAKLDESRQQAEAMKEERSQLLYKAEEEKRTAEEEYDRLSAISENIKAMLQSMESASSMPSSHGSGSFIWPCTGPITSYYGWRIHPIFGTRKYHSGMDIAVDYGTPIHAAAAGVVIYSGWMGGYGYAIMIDHGGGLVTIYGHNSRLAVGEGTQVSQGQLVAYAGSTGYSTGPHCHFEARLHGETTDPLNYLP